MRDRVQGAGRGNVQPNREETLEKKQPREQPTALPSRLLGGWDLAPLQGPFRQADIVPRVLIPPCSTKGAHAATATSADHPGPSGKEPEGGSAKQLRTRRAFLPPVISWQAIKSRHGKPRLPQVSDKSASDAHAAGQGQRACLLQQKPERLLLRGGAVEKAFCVQNALARAF